MIVAYDFPIHRINALSYIDYEFNAKSQEALRCRCGESSIIAL